MMMSPRTGLSAEPRERLSEVIERATKRRSTMRQSPTILRSYLYVVYRHGDPELVELTCRWCGKVSLWTGAAGAVTGLEIPEVKSREAGWSIYSNLPVCPACSRASKIRCSCCSNYIPPEHAITGYKDGMMAPFCCYRCRDEFFIAMQSGGLLNVVLNASHVRRLTEDE